MEPTHILIYLLTLTCVSNALLNVDKARKDEVENLKQVYSNLNGVVKTFSREAIKTVMHFMEGRSQDLNISTTCKGNFFKILAGLRDFKHWAVSFLDASGKINDGLLIGNAFIYGNYDQCLNSTVLKKNGAIDFRGKYCLVSIGVHLPNEEIFPDSKERIEILKNVTRNMVGPISELAYKAEFARTKRAKFGLCVPSGCDISDIREFTKYGAKHLFLNLTVDYCETEDSLTYFTPTRIVILCLFIFFIILVIIGSVIEQYSAKRKIKFEHPVIRGVMCFSLPYNFQKFSSTKVTEENLSFLNGVRVLTLFYIMLSHHYLVKAISLMFRDILLHATKSAPRFFFQLIVNGTFSVDVFFFIGGFLNCYLREKKNFTFFSFSSALMIVIHRLLRILPIYIFSILLGVMLHARGPMVRELDETFLGPCRTEWWKNLLFINNFYNPEQQCAPHTWYLAADMQLFFVSLFAIPLLFRKPKMGILVNLALIVLPTVYTFIKSWTLELPPVIMINIDQSTEGNDNWMRLLLFSPFTHASSYFSGVLLGFFITKRKSYSLSKMTLAFGWIVSTTLALTVLFVSKRWNSNIPYTRLGSALYASLSRPIFSWSIGWLIFCCFTGYGGIVNKILSYKVWIPLNRLGISAYMLSIIVQLFYFANLRNSQEFIHIVETWNYFGDVAATFMTSLPMALLFEFPFGGLEKVIFHRKDKSSEIKENEMKENGDMKHENGIISDKDKNSANEKELKEKEIIMYENGINNDKNSFQI